MQNRSYSYDESFLYRDKSDDEFRCLSPLTPTTSNINGRPMMLPTGSFLESSPMPSMAGTPSSMSPSSPENRLLLSNEMASSVPGDHAHAAAEDHNLSSSPQPLHLRTNFKGGYVPPQVGQHQHALFMVSPGGMTRLRSSSEDYGHSGASLGVNDHSDYSAPQRLSRAVSPTNDSVMGESVVPFDQRADSRHQQTPRVPPLSYGGIDDNARMDLLRSRHLAVTRTQADDASRPFDEEQPHDETGKGSRLASSGVSSIDGRATLPFVGGNEGRASIGPNERTIDVMGRFRMPGPRVLAPKKTLYDAEQAGDLLIHEEGHRMGPMEVPMQVTPTRDRDSPDTSYHQFGNESTTGSVPQEPGRRGPHVKQEHALPPMSSTSRHSDPGRQKGESGGNENDDDSLFDFVPPPDESGRRCHPRHRHPTKGANLACYSDNNMPGVRNQKGKTFLSSAQAEDSDTSREHGYPIGHFSGDVNDHTALWKQHSIGRDEAQRDSSTGTTDRSTSLNGGAGVSFGNRDTIHRFEQTEANDENTLAGRSLNSDYTKSLESEVEDVIKDIFMIGTGKTNNPGRRKIKFAPGIKAHRKQKKATPDVAGHEQEDSYTQDDTIDDTLEDNYGEEEYDLTESDRAESDRDDSRFVRRSTKSYNKARSRHGRGKGHNREADTVCSTLDGTYEEKKEEENEEKNPLTDVWYYMSSALGLEEETVVTSKTDEAESMNPSSRAVANGSRTSASACSSTRKKKGTEEKSTGKEEKSPRSLQDLWDFASDALFGSASSGETDLDSAGGDESKAPNSVLESQFGDATERTGQPLPSDEDVIKKAQASLNKAPALEQDMRLIDLAVQAARSAHKLQGYDFDDRYDINIVTDIKFSVVDMALPLGLIFQENDLGCWITKVIPGGHGHMSGSVQVGDQLAAIDGVSAIRMKVDEIAAIIREKTTEIELTFLRYIGPLRCAPGAIVEEGYEIAADDKESLASRQSRMSSASASRKQRPDTAAGPSQPRNTSASRNISNQKLTAAIKANTAAAKARDAKNANVADKKRFLPFLGRRKKQSTPE